MSRRRSKLLVLVAAAALTLTGCAGLPPGVAAQVGDATISENEVDDFAAGLCDYLVATRGGEQDSRDTRRQALSQLILSQLAHDYAADEVEIDAGTVDNTVKQVAEALGDMPAEDRAAFLRDVRRAVAAEQYITQAVYERLAAEGVSQPSQEQLVSASEELISGWADRAGVEVDPRFGTWSVTHLEGDGGSLSVPVDDVATDTAGQSNVTTCH